MSDAAIQQNREAAQKAANERLTAGLRELRKQCKTFSKNELITALIDQTGKYLELQGICQQLIKENETLKGSNETTTSQP